MTDTVRGPRKKRATECIVDRATKTPKGIAKDAWVFEVLEDRVAEAGWLGALTAFRAPLLKSPLELKRTWHFNRTTYEVVERGPCRVRAGKYALCVTIETKPADGSAPAVRSTYAKGVGLVRVVKGDEVREAIRVSEVRAPKKPPTTRP